MARRSTSGKSAQPVPRRRRWIIVGLVGVLVYLSYGTDGGLIRMIQAYREKAALQTEIESLKEEQLDLERKINLLKNDRAFLEKVARERYLMGRSDEVIYRVLKKKEEE